MGAIGCHRWDRAGRRVEGCGRDGLSRSSPAGVWVDSASLGDIYHRGESLEEFVGPDEPGGWALAGTIVPIAYIAWSVWLILIGAFLLSG